MEAADVFPKRSTLQCTLSILAPRRSATAWMMRKFRLMGDHQLDIFRSQAGFFEAFFVTSTGREPPTLNSSGPSSEFPSRAPVRRLGQTFGAARTARGATAQGSAGLDDRAEQAPIVGLIFQHDCPGAIPEQHAGRPVSPVDHGTQGIRANQQDTVILSAFEIAMGNRQAVHKPGTGGRNIEGGDIIHAQAGLEQAGGGRKGILPETVATRITSRSCADRPVALSAVSLAA